MNQTTSKRRRAAELTAITMTAVTAWFVATAPYYLHF